MNSAHEIAHQIRNGKLTAEAVMQHFIKQAQLAQEKSNCITVFIKEALQEAQKLDKQIASGTSFPESEFPLLGVPISIKDVFDMKGYPAVSGYKAHLNNSPEEDVNLIKLIRECGGIPFCKTNVCQFTMTLESSNPIYGTTTNPDNAEFTSGGSTSGEAPLIKLGGSVLGIGSDIGGSLRVPAHFCGVYTLKPTPQRIPGLDHVRSNKGQEAVLVSIGPVAGNVKDLKLFMKAFLDKQCWQYDDLGIPLPYRETKLSSTLKVGYILSDGVFPASPACQRAVLEVIASLKSAGHEVFPFDFPELNEIRAVGQALLSADNLSFSLRKLTGEGIHETISRYIRISTLPNFVKKSIGFILRLCGQPIASSFVYNSCKPTLEEMWHVQSERSRLRQKFQAQWKNQKMDVLIMPPLATPAFKHGNFLNIAPGLVYPFLANLFNLPSGIIPVTHVSYKDKATAEWLRKQLPTDIKPEYIHQKLYAHACPDVPLPVGVQVVGMRFDDEKILSIMDLIDQLLHRNNSNPESN